ncbi:hypothetical protein J6590_051947 [Homalodisca vitripennis]|nr:hypothetical protein J6590_051947 [Homalodisca vitripennis]
MTQLKNCIINSVYSLQNAIAYSKLNDLAINPDKTTQVHFSKKKQSQIIYSLIIWGTSLGNLKRVLVLQKKAVRTLANLEPLQSCQQAYPTLGILTSYVNTSMKSRLTWTFTITPHAMPQGLPFRNTEQLSLKKKSYIGRRFKNLLPDFLQNLTGDRLKNSLREFLLKKPVYTIEEFLESANARTT